MVDLSVSRNTPKHLVATIKIPLAVKYEAWTPSSL